MKQPDLIKDEFV